MKRREIRERDEAAARDQAEQRTEALLARLKAQEAAARLPVDDHAVAAPAGSDVPESDLSESDLPESDLPAPDATPEAEGEPA